MIGVTNSNSLVHKMANVKRFNFHHTKAISPLSECNFDEFLVTLKVVFKIKGACNASTDAISVISVTNSCGLVHKTTIVKRFDFRHTKAIAHCQSAIFDEFLVTLKVVFKIKGACNASTDAISVISVTNSCGLVHKTTIVKRFDFRHTKAIAHCQSAIFDEFLVTLKVVFKIKGACNASTDAISVISVTNSCGLVHKTTIVKRFDFRHTKFIPCPLSECNFDEFLVTLKVVFKIKGACNASTDAISVISVTNSNSLVHKTTIVKRFNFHHTKAISPLSECNFDEFLVTLKVVFKIKGACNASTDAISVISVTNSYSLVHKTTIVKRFYFHHTKAIVHEQSVTSPFSSSPPSA